MQEQPLCCAVVRDLAALYTDGQASPETAAAVKSHLAGCAECHRYYKDFRRSTASLRDAAHCAAPPCAADGEVTAPADGYAHLARRLRRRSALERGLYALCMALLAAAGFVAARQLGAPRRR